MKMNWYKAEDIGFGDLTSDLIIPDKTNAKAVLNVKQPCILAGIAVIKNLFSQEGIEVTTHFNDGDKINKTSPILSLYGDIKTILKLERLAINILMIMSGIATKTKKMIKALDNKNIRVACTRKTIPGFRKFSKDAVIIGGGDPHRNRLDDHILIKDNHLAYANIPQCISKAKKASFCRKIEVEVESTEEAIIAIENGADIIMLDNMSPEIVNNTIKTIKKKKLKEKILIEVSGGITLENIASYKKCDIDIISSSDMTLNFIPINFNMEVEHS